MKKSSIFLLTLFLACACHSTDRHPKLVAPPDPPTASFILMDNRIFVDAYLNGQGPFKFIFDTGGANSISPAVAKRLGLALTPAGTASGAGEGAQEMSRSKLTTFRVGAVELTDQEVMVIDNSAIQHAFRFPALDGIFGYELLKEYLVLIDFEESRLFFYSKPEDFPAKGFQPIAFQLEFDKPMIQAKINGLEANTLLDTGDRSALTVTKSFRRQQRIEQAFAGMPEVTSGFGIGGPIPARLARLESLVFGQNISLVEVMTRAPTTVGGFNAIPGLDASVGNEILKQFHVAFDYKSEKVFFKPNKRFGATTVFAGAVAVQRPSMRTAAPSK